MRGVIQWKMVLYSQEIGQLEAVFTFEPFSRKSVVMGPLISQKTVSMTFFTDYCTRNFFFSPVCFYSFDCLFNSGLRNIFE